MTGDIEERLKNILAEELSYPRQGNKFMKQHRFMAEVWA
jgi:hypothetical protein